MQSSQIEYLSLEKKENQKLKKGQSPSYRDRMSMIKGSMKGKFNNKILMQVNNLSPHLSIKLFL